MSILAAFMVPHPPLIIPEVGRGEEKKIQRTIDAYEVVGRWIGELEPETIVLVTPHQVMYSDYLHISPGKGAEGDLSRFGAGQVKMAVSYDVEFVEKLCTLTEERGLPAGTLGERDKRLDHGTMVPLYFVDRYWTGYELVRIGLSGLPLAEHYRLGRYIQETADILDKKTVLIASGDLSHRLKEDGPYGFQKEGPEYDARIMEVMEKGAFKELFGFTEEFCERAGECGHRSFTVLAGALDRTEIVAERLSYEGPFGVGYGICAYTSWGRAAQDWQPPELLHAKVLKQEQKDQDEKRIREHIMRKREQEDAHVRLARQTIELYVRTGRMPEKDMLLELPEEMSDRRAGVFVSLKKDGRLRGCIGTIQAVQPSIAEEIVCNAVSAATRDPRFLPVREDELDELSISVDVLGDAVPVTSLAELDVKRYGVIVTKGCRRGLLLPDLDGVDTVEEQVKIAREKAGIALEEEIRLERFEVIRHH